MHRLTDFLQFGNIYFNDITYSPETIWENINAVAENLTKRSVSNSPFVYLYAHNHIKTVYGLFGIIKSGRICVLVDPAIGRFELEEMMKDAPPGALIKPDKETDTFSFYIEIEVMHYQLSPTRIQGLDDVAIMLYTMADDGFAKGAMLTHENVLVNARAIVESNNVKKGSVSCALMALHHLFALQTGVIGPSITQGDLLIDDLSELSTIKIVASHIEKTHTTHLYAVPVIYLLLKKTPLTKNIIGKGISLGSGGIKMPTSLWNIYKNEFNCEIREGYGITEASPVCTWHQPHDIIKFESVGRAFPCCEVKILNDQNQELPKGREGEICVKGPNVFKGYFCNEAATQNALKNGWLHTGDLGTMDEDGYVFLKSLKKRMLNLGGNKVYPAEVERLMKKHINVLSAELYGEPNEIIGDIVKAKVRLRNNSAETQEEFKAWCYKNFTRYKVPKHIDYLS
jgi:long-chain acyl-CoA synthetase